MIGVSVDEEEFPATGDPKASEDEGPAVGLDVRGETICKIADDGVLDNSSLSSSASSSLVLVEVLCEEEGVEPP